MKIYTTVLATTLLTCAGAAILSAGGVTTTAQVKKTSKASMRRQDIITRLDKQNEEIIAKIKAGTMTQGQGDELAEKDKKIREEEKEMASKHDGGITRTEMKSLELELNDIRVEMEKQ